jgi:uncharacterized membrane protein (DUF2068 family)
MSIRPLPVTVAAILMALFSLMNFPGPWWYAVPGAEETPAFIIYSGIVLGIVGIVAAVGLWLLKTWSLWLTIVVCVVNILFNASGLVMALPGGLKAAIAVQTIGFILTFVLVVLPTARRAFATT